MRLASKPRAGMSVLEIVIATFVLTVGMLSLFQLQRQTREVVAATRTDVLIGSVVDDFQQALRLLSQVEVAALDSPVGRIPNASADPSAGIDPEDLGIAVFPLDLTAVDEDYEREAILDLESLEIQRRVSAHRVSGQIVELVGWIGYKGDKDRNLTREFRVPLP